MLGWIFNFFGGDKARLLQLAADGAPRPSAHTRTVDETKLRSTLAAHSARNSSVYDPEFESDDEPTTPEN